MLAAPTRTFCQSEEILQMTASPDCCYVMYGHCSMQAPYGETPDLLSSLHFCFQQQRVYDAECLYCRKSWTLIHQRLSWTMRSQMPVRK